MDVRLTDGERVAGTAAALCVSAALGCTVVAVFVEPPVRGWSILGVATLLVVGARLLDRWERRLAARRRDAS